MNGKWRRILSLLICSVMLISFLPHQALAAEENRFCLVVEAGGELVIAPEYVTYTEGQTIGEALDASGHTFSGLASGQVFAVNGVAGNFTRSDQNGSYDLSLPASEVTHYRFSENVSSSQPNEGLLMLMTAMADYAEETDDVKAAAKSAYDAAYSGFVGAGGPNAQTLAQELNDAVSTYKLALEGEQFAVSFSDGEKAYSEVNYAGVSINVVNSYGKIWQDSGAGSLKLPAGNYHFHISQNGLHMEGDVVVSGEMTITGKLPEGEWLLKDQFRLSGSYGAESDDETVSHFSDDEFILGQWDGRSVTVEVPDTFTGTVYTNAQYNTSVLSKVPALTAIYDDASTGADTEETLVFDSLTVGPTQVLKRGARGNMVIYRISQVAADGYTYAQDYSVSFVRTPTLTGISVADQDGVDQAATVQFDSDLNAYEYKVLDTVTAVTVDAVPMDERYLVTINGEDGMNGVTVTLDTDENGNPVETTVEVAVSSNGFENIYNLTIKPGEGRKITFQTTAAAVTLEVVNSNGLVLPFTRTVGADSYNKYQYTLVPGETYSYVATRDTYFHTMDDFSLEELANSVVTVDVPAEDWLTDLAFGVTTASTNKGSIPMDTIFSAADHNYVVEMEDTESVVNIWVNGDTDATIQSVYNQIHSSKLYHGVQYITTLKAGQKSGTLMKRILLPENPYGNTVTIRLSKQDGGITYYQDYEIEFQRKLSLKSISAQCNGSIVSLVDDQGSVGYVSSVREYYLTVPMAANVLQLVVTPYAAGASNTVYGEDTTGYEVSVDGAEVTDAVEVELNGGIETQTVTVTVTNSHVADAESEYVLHVLKSPPVVTEFAISPEDAILSLYEDLSGQRIWPVEGNTYQLSEGFSYSYMLTKHGYVGKSGTIEVTRDDNSNMIIKIGSDSFAVEETDDGGSATVTMTLAQAPANNSLNPSIYAQWPDFRGNSNNNAVSSTRVPISAEGGSLYWATQLGTGTDSNAVGSPIIVDGAIITYAGDVIYRVDAVSGEILATGTMDHKSSFAITPPTYYEGMIFVALSNGTVQAFNAVTLESLWVFEDAMGGQPNSPLTVKDGYLYTGFWNSETSAANFVCLSVTDEDPSQTKERKCASWYYTRRGGFYWAGAYVGDGFVLVGTDDGYAGYTSQNSSLLLMDAKTGKILDSWDGLNADIRSSVVYDGTRNAYYFTSKGGSFYSVQVIQGASGWELTNQWSVKLSNGYDAGTPMSTSSPVVYNGRAYVGVSGVGQFSAYSGHNLSVIDLNSRTVAYRVETQGYPQTSGLLTTAYEAESGYVYVYFFDNQTPGKIRILRDRAGQTSADYLTAEGSGSFAYALFTPSGEHAEYAICSPIVDAYGTMYFKNDSGYLMAFGSAVEKIEVTTLPNKTSYLVGETFDPTGMVVTATFANGLTRDITRYVTFHEEALTVEDNSFAISYEYVMYQNQENGTRMDTGVVCTTPQTILELKVISSTLGDVNADGEITEADAAVILGQEAKNSSETLSVEYADVSGDGIINSNDAVLILQYLKGYISVFPVEETTTTE